MVILVIPSMHLLCMSKAAVSVEPYKNAKLTHSTINSAVLDTD